MSMRGMNCRFVRNQAAAYPLSGVAWRGGSPSMSVAVALEDSQEM